MYLLYLSCPMTGTHILCICVECVGTHVSCAILLVLFCRLSQVVIFAFLYVLCFQAMGGGRPSSRKSVHHLTIQAHPIHPHNIGEVSQLVLLLRRNLHEAALEHLLTPQSATSLSRIDICTFVHLRSFCDRHLTCLW